MVSRRSKSFRHEFFTHWKLTAARDARWKILGLVQGGKGRGVTQALTRRTIPGVQRDRVRQQRLATGRISQVGWLSPFVPLVLVSSQTTMSLQISSPALRFLGKCLGSPPSLPR